MRTLTELAEVGKVVERKLIESSTWDSDLPDIMEPWLTLIELSEWADRKRGLDDCFPRFSPDWFGASGYRHRVAYLAIGAAIGALCEREGISLGDGLAMNPEATMAIKEALCKFFPEDWGE